jgi:hypothetical protein
MDKAKIDRDGCSEGNDLYRVLIRSARWRWNRSSKPRQSQLSIFSVGYAEISEKIQTGVLDCATNRVHGWRTRATLAPSQGLERKKISGSERCVSSIEVPPGRPEGTDTQMHSDVPNAMYALPMSSCGSCQKNALKVESRAMGVRSPSTCSAYRLLSGQIASSEAEPSLWLLLQGDPYREIFLIFYLFSFYT